MEKRKLTKEDLDKVRNIEGFPLGKDEDIIALSDPPYYTACPNPFIDDFLKEHGTPYDEESDDYSCEPFAADVSEGKSDPVYMAHAYHTKVPHKAIMRYILHYTKPGDIVFDGFCGTGMTGVAAQMCGSKDSTLKLQFLREMPEAEWGTRYAILNDLSPAATFIAYNYNTPVNAAEFAEEANKILAACEKECGWMYETEPTDEIKKSNFKYSQGNIEEDSDKEKGRINYTVWSDVFICPHCGEEIIFWDIAVDHENGSVKNIFNCPQCNMELKKTDCKRAQETHYDDLLGKSVTMAKQVPVLINYTYDGKRYEKAPDKSDTDLINKIDSMKIPFFVPTDRMCEGGESRRNDKYGITNVHQFYTKRNLYILASIYNKFKTPKKIFLFTSIVQRASKLFKWSKNQAGPLSGTLYVSSCVYETSIFNLIKNKHNIYKGWNINAKNSEINCASSKDLKNILSDSIDYIFTDPPFGANLNYSELSFIWEAWLKVFTNNKTEAIMNEVQHKGLLEYQELMEGCFREYYRVLKPGRWMTVEFHNSQNAVWNAIRETIQKAGFIIADVRTLNKKQGSFKQVTTKTAVKQDLVISAYKPKESFIREFTNDAGNEETAWMFVRQHLEKLPVVVMDEMSQCVEPVEERQAYLLFDRMVAYHILNGIPVPLGATEFYNGLEEKFIKRDEMYFLPNQINEYDNARIEHDFNDIQMSLIVTSEKSAVEWLYKQLETPQTYQEIQPKFMQEIRTLDKYEELPELSTLLEENFIKDENGKWYIPDNKNKGDLEKLRKKNLLREFDGYLSQKGKLKLFRTEAIREGFNKLWADKNYKLIVETAQRLPESIVQEDEKILLFYDLSLGRI